MMKILVTCAHPVSQKIAGTNARAIEIARQLSSKFHVELAAPSPEITSIQSITVLPIDKPLLNNLHNYDIIITNGTTFPARTYAANHTKPHWIFDLYNPFLLEVLAAGEESAREIWPRVKHLHRLTRFLLRRADLVLCASPQQKEFWTGALYAAGRLWPANENNNIRPEDLVQVVPFGIPQESPASAAETVQSLHPAIHDNDKLLLWGGGIWNWLDPLTLIQAMKVIAAKRSDAKLLFMGTYSSEHSSSAEPMVTRARALAAELGLLDKCVFFQDGWVSYEARTSYLMRADLAVCLSPESLENTYSFRTRLVDAIWADLPIVCTQGGFIADWVERNRAGITIAGHDPIQAAKAILDMLEPVTHEASVKNIQNAKAELQWNVCVQPLLRYCSESKEQTGRSGNTCGGRLDYFEYKTMSLLDRLLNRL